MRIPPYEMLGKDKIVLSLMDFEDMLDVMAYDEAKTKARNQEAAPVALLERLLSGESPVRVWREYRGLVQADLGKMAGVSQTTIAEIESGRKNGSIETLKAIASALGVDLEDII